MNHTRSHSLLAHKRMKTKVHSRSASRKHRPRAYTLLYKINLPHPALFPATVILFVNSLLLGRKLRDLCTESTLDQRPIQARNTIIL